VVQFHHLEKVNGKDDIPYMKWKMNHQPDIISSNITYVHVNPGLINHDYSLEAHFQQESFVPPIIGLWIYDTRVCWGQLRFAEDSSGRWAPYQFWKRHQLSLRQTLAFRLLHQVYTWYIPDIYWSSWESHQPTSALNIAVITIQLKSSDINWESSPKTRNDLWNLSIVSEWS